METVSLSVAIPAYNEEKYIGRLLDDLVIARDNTMEIVVSDNGSTDNTVDIVERYTEKYSFIKLVHARKPGVSFARNTGALYSVGEFVLFLDADQRISKEFLKKSMEEIKEKKLDVASYYFDPAENNLIDKFIFFVYNDIIFRSMQYFSPIGCGGAGIIARRSIHKAIGGFDEGIDVVQDMDYVKRAATKGKFRMLSCVRSPFDMRRFHNESRFEVHGKWFVAGIAYFVGIKQSPWTYFKR